MLFKHFFCKFFLYFFLLSRLHKYLSIKVGEILLEKHQIYKTSRFDYKINAIKNNVLFRKCLLQACFGNIFYVYFFILVFVVSLFLFHFFYLLRFEVFLIHNCRLQILFMVVFICFYSFQNCTKYPVCFLIFNTF